MEFHYLLGLGGGATGEPPETLLLPCRRRLPGLVRSWVAQELASDCRAVTWAGSGGVRYRVRVILDAVVESGNTADSTRCIPMITWHVANFGSAPEQVALDGGYAGRINLAEARAMGVRDAVFHKGRGLGVADMASSPVAYGRLRRIGPEAARFARNPREARKRTGAS